MADITTVRPNTKPSHAPFTDRERILSDHPDNGIGATPWPEFRTQLLEIISAAVAEARLAGFSWEEVADISARNLLEVASDQVGRRLVYCRADDKAFAATAPGAGPLIWGPISSLSVSWSSILGKPDIGTAGGEILKAGSYAAVRSLLEIPVASSDYAATETIDFSEPGWKTIDLTGNVTIAFSNISSGVEAHRVFRAGAVNRIVTVTGCKLPNGVQSPITLTANTWAVISVKSFGTSETDIVFGWSVVK